MLQVQLLKHGDAIHCIDVTNAAQVLAKADTLVRYLMDKQVTLNTKNTEIVTHDM
jgi:hypothetical protein